VLLAEGFEKPAAPHTLHPRPSRPKLDMLTTTLKSRTRKKQMLRASSSLRKKEKIYCLLHNIAFYKVMLSTELTRGVKTSIDHSAMKLARPCKVRQGLALKTAVSKKAKANFPGDEASQRL
jgi:hypothetical protein